MSKTCIKCQKEFQIVEFYVDRRTSDGRTSACKTCVRQKNALSYQRNREQRQITSAAYRATNREQLNEKQSAYYRKNVDDAKAWHHEYTKTGRYGITRDQRNWIWELQGHKCPCGCDASESQTNVDHDHSCCSGPGSCGNCIRGLLCQSANCKDLLAGRPAIVFSDYTKELVQ